MPDLFFIPTVIILHNGMMQNMFQSVSRDAKNFLWFEYYEDCEQNLVKRANQNQWKIVGEDGYNYATFKSEDGKDIAVEKCISVQF
tara:strand:- start:183 stop:440 length:258 start_codon:yes stop_codon:yes gene_type:complete